MTYGLTALKRIQISNPEDTPGTAEAANEILFGTMSINAVDNIFHRPEQDRNSLAMFVETPFEVQKDVEIEFEGELYDRLAVFLMSMAVRGNVTATQPDSMAQPNAYEWLFEPALSAPNTPDQTNGIDTFTLEYGDNVQGYEVNHTYVAEVEISGSVNEPVTVTATLKGQTITETTVTAALTAPGAKYFAFNNSNFYIDTSYAGIGGTAVTGLLRGFTWAFETMFTPLYAADGTLSFVALNEAPKTVNLEMQYYRDDTNEQAERDKFVSQSLFFPRIELVSNGEMDSGESNPEYIYLDGAFRYTEYPTYEDEDGTQVITVTAQAEQDPTSSKLFGVTVGTTMDAFTA